MVLRDTCQVGGTGAGRGVDTTERIPLPPPGPSLPLNGDAVEASDSPGDEVTVAPDPALAAETVDADLAAQSAQPLGSKRKRQREGYYRDLHRGKKD